MRTNVGKIAALLLVVAAACTRGDESAGSREQTASAVPPAGEESGVFLDPKTGLEWTVRDHEVSLAWHDADRHCQNLTLGERHDWRLPGIKEIQALFDKRFEEPCGDRTCHLDPGIRLGGPYVWTASARGAGTRFYFDFMFGTSLSPGTPPTLVRRVLCVRQASERANAVASEPSLAK